MFVGGRVGRECGDELFGDHVSFPEHAPVKEHNTERPVNAQPARCHSLTSPASPASFASPALLETCASSVSLASPASLNLSVLV